MGHEDTKNTNLVPGAFVILVAIATIVSPARVDAQTQPCDRACLIGLISQYVGALVARDSSKLPLAPDVKFTEDTKVLKTGEGLWQTATGLRGYRQDIIDVRQGVAGAYLVVEEKGLPAELALRLKIVNRRITEIETMVVRSAAEGMIFAVDQLKAANPAMTLRPDPSSLNTREALIKIALTYPEGLRIGSFVKANTPFAQDAYRLENGRLMAGKECTFIPGCDNIKEQRIPTLAEIKARVAAVDEDMGIVWLRMDFGRGSVKDPESSLTVWEAFKVYGAEIHAVEAFMEVMPRGASSGWD
jgi:hypothetical protein